jgi:Response regulator containing a CheY-like receiver domain and an HD-GYP domain
LSKKDSFVLGPVMKIYIIILVAVISILFSFLLLHITNKNREYEDKIVINVFGKQRMYTQMMSKDTSRLLVLMQASKMNSTYMTEQERKEEIAGIKKNLEKAGSLFGNTLKEIHNNNILVDSDSIHFDATFIRQSEYLKKMDLLWADFDEAVHTVVRSETINSQMLKSVDFINSNNMQLLDLSDKLLEQLLKNSLRADRDAQALAYTLIGLLFLILVISLFHLQRYLIQPFNQLYKGISEIGLNNNYMKQHLPTRNKVMPLVTEVNDMFLKINYLISLIENINNNNSFTETLSYINQKFSAFIPYNYIGIALISADKKMLRASYGVSDGTINGLPDRIVGANWLISDTSLGALLNSGEARIINDLEKYCEDKPIKPYNQVILDAGIRASIALPLKVSGDPVGMIFFSSRNKNVYNEEHINFLHTLANSIAISFNRNIFTSEILYSSILALANLSEARDEDTGEHMERMAKYSRLIAQLLYENEYFQDEISFEYIDQIERFSPLHDIGKVGILDGILLKPGRLTPEEFTEMKKHAVFGSEVLRSADQNLAKMGVSPFGMGIDIAEGHHEKWDGSGYPYGKKGAEIPLSARIVAIADVFDALTSKRPYKAAYSLDKSFGIIEEGRATHFDPVIVDVFLANRKHVEELYYRFKYKKEID